MSEKRRYRLWVAVVYPESAPERWEDVLNDSHVQWACSPLHEFDHNPDGELKKAHWHILLSFDGVQSYEQVKELLEPLNCTIPIPCKSAKGMIRYFAHLDNPEKFQYDKALIRAFNGFDIAPYLEYSVTEQKFIIGEMMDWCTDNECYEPGILMDYAKRERYDDWFEVLTTHKGLHQLKVYCDSKRNALGYR